MVAIEDRFLDKAVMEAQREILTMVRGLLDSGDVKASGIGEQLV